MKKILLPFIAVAFSLLSASAQEEAILISAADFPNIILGNNMKVVLKPSKEENTDLKISQQAVEKLRLEISGSTLHINPRKSLNDHVIYLLVDKLQRLSLGAETHLSTEGFLQASKIDVYLENGARAKIRTTGKINAFPIGDLDIQTISSPIPGYPVKANEL